MQIGAISTPINIMSLGQKFHLISSEMQGPRDDDTREALEVSTLGGNPEQWDADFSRFFHFPHLSFFSSPLNLRPVSRHQGRSNGTWISSSIPALLYLLPNPPAILVVLIQGKIHEEHFVSNLHFSWPQVSCSTECPIRGSRVVFASYRDGNSQVQKFALRFSASRIAQTFFDAVKGCSKTILEIGYLRDDTGCEDSSISEYIGSNGFLQSRDEESGFTSPNVSYCPEKPVLDFQTEQPMCCQQPLPENNSDTILRALPPCFADLLALCPAENLKEPPNEPVDTDFMSQIMKYMLDPSFNDMLAKAEKAVSDLEGGYSL